MHSCCRMLPWSKCVHNMLKTKNISGEIDDMSPARCFCRAAAVTPALMLPRGARSTWNLLGPRYLILLITCTSTAESCECVKHLTVHIDSSGEMRTTTCFWAATHIRWQISLIYNCVIKKVPQLSVRRCDHFHCERLSDVTSWNVYSGSFI